MQKKLAPLFFVFLSFTLSFSFSMAQTEKTCAVQLGSDDPTNLIPSRGQAIGPIEWLSNIKLQFLPSKALKEFSTSQYIRASEEIKLAASKGEDFVPRTTEAYAALIDYRLNALKISIMDMDPVFRHKTYSLIAEILKTQDVTAASYGEDLANVLFRGHFEKPTSFKYLFTHLPKEGAQEILIQHIQTTVMIASIVEIAKLGKTEVEPQTPEKWGRLKSFWRAHKELTIAAVYISLDIVQSITSKTFSALLPPLNLYKLKTQKALVEKTLEDHTPTEAISILSEQMPVTVSAQYYYSVVNKILNWYTIGYILSPFFITTYY